MCPTGVMVTMRSPSAVGSFRPMGADTWSVGSLDADLQAFVGERNCRLFAPFHEDDGACARFFEFLVEAEGFEFVEEQVGLCLTWGVVIGSKPVGIHVDQMCGSAVRRGCRRVLPLAMVKVGETMGS